MYSVTPIIDNDLTMKDFFGCWEYVREPDLIDITDHSISHFLEALHQGGSIIPEMLSTKYPQSSRASLGPWSSEVATLHAAAPSLEITNVGQNLMLLY